MMKNNAIKKCSKCDLEKSNTDFSAGSVWCRLCRKDYQIEYRKNETNRQKHCQKSSEWNKNNKYRRNAYLSLYNKKNRKENLTFRIKANLRTRLYCAIKRQQKNGSAVKDLGCTIEEFKNYIASKFLQNMSWDNYGEWHLDHKKPLSSFDLTNKEEFLKACHYSNLQPLWAIDNLRKNDKVA